MKVTAIQGRGRLHVWLLAAILLVGAYFRLHELGRPAFRADTILLWNLALREVPPIQVITKWFDVSGAMGQMPMPAFIMQVVQGIIPGPVTPFSARLPFALFGILTIPVAFWAGRSQIGRGFGVFLAALVALHPFTVYFSREAYFYATEIFGVFLYFWATARAAERLVAGAVLARNDLILIGGAIFFCAYSQVTGVFICIAGVPYLGLLAFRHSTGAVRKSNLIRLIAIHAAFIAPLLFISWGYLPILKQIFDVAAYSAQLVEKAGVRTLPSLGKIALQYSWGWTWPGLVILASALILLAEKTIRTRGRQMALPAWFVVSQLVLFLVGRKVAGALFEPRYLAGIYPFYFALVAYGLYPDASDSKAQRAARILPAGAALLFLLYPAYLVTELRGKPTPYRDIVAWADSHLPQGAPVVVDRWFEPWNELKAHPATNVIFTFTVPNEPVEAYIQNKWRQTAADFFEKFPDAAYLEIAKSYFDDQAVGPWQWPRDYFARHIAFTNEAALKLRHLGLAARGDFYLQNTNRVIVELFYNTEDEVLERARKAGRDFALTYGKGWSYTKLWQMIQGDFRDWRVLGGAAELRLFNLAGQEALADVVLRGVAWQQAKNVTASAGYSHEFPANQVVEWVMSGLRLPPGLTSLRLQEAGSSGQSVPLLVESVSIRAAAPR